MKYSKHDVKLAMINLCLNQRKHVMSFPVRENIGVYDWQLDIEYNEDFAIWELELQNV